MFDYFRPVIFCLYYGVMLGIGYDTRLPTGEVTTTFFDNVLLQHGRVAYVLLFALHLDLGHLPDTHTLRASI